MVLDMGQPVRIIDLARNLIELSGYVPEEDISIEITGLKPGEKLSEELYTDGEAMELTRHPKIFVGRANGHEQIEATLELLHGLVDDGDEASLRRIVHGAIKDSRLIPTVSRISPSEGSGVAG
jgi:FlaA1/EpsC-like NDP-sugar epimerase